MLSPDELSLSAGRLLPVLETGRAFDPDQLTSLVDHVEEFCERWPARQEFPRKTARMLTELVPALDAASQQYEGEAKKQLQDAAATLFAIMLEKL